MSFRTSPFFSDNGLNDDNDAYATELYSLADFNQTKAIVEATFPLTNTNKGLRFVFTSCSKTPTLLRSDGVTEVYSPDYKFVSGKDEIIRKGGTEGYIVPFGDVLYQSLDAVDRLQEEHNIHIKLINKCTLNVIDHDMVERITASNIFLVVESLSAKTGLGIKFGS